MHRWRKWCAAAALCAAWSAARPAAPITISINYFYDLPANGGNNFFGNAQAKAALEAAASYYSSVLTDTFDAIVVPPPYYSTAQGSNGYVTWSWEQRFPNPSSNLGTEVVVTNPPVAVDQYVVYVGGSSLAGGAAGQGGAGGYARPAPVVHGTNSFTAQDNTNIQNITANFDALLAWRGETPNTFARWGGAITFDNDGSTPWYFNHLGTPSGNVTDFYSVAIHELGHALGFGASAPWTTLVDAANVKFTGTNAKALNGNQPVPLASASDLGHWAYGTQSVVYGKSTAQEAAMDPDLQNGTRKKLTELEAAALKDIGWSLGPAPSVNGDYNDNDIVDAGDYILWRKYLGQTKALPNRAVAGTISAADYAVWRSNYGKMAVGTASGSGALIGGLGVPEPASGAMAILLAMFLGSARPRFRR